MADDKENKVNHMVKIMMDDLMYERLKTYSDYNDQSIEEFIYQTLNKSIDEAEKQIFLGWMEADVERKEAEEVKNRRSSFKVVSDEEKE